MIKWPGPTPPRPEFAWDQDHPTAMNRSTKTTLVVLGVLATLLLATQLTMGLLIVRGQAGKPLPGNYPLPKLVKAHQHSGYLTVGVAFVYVVGSLAAIVRAPAATRGEPSARA